MSRYLLKKLSDVFCTIFSGEWGSEPQDDVNDVSVLRTTNFTNSGLINYENVIKRDIDKEKIKAKHLKYGDIIIEKSGGSDNQPVGRVVYFDNSDEVYLCNNFTSVLRTDNNIVKSKYVFYFMFFQHQCGVTQLLQNKTTGIRNLQLKRYMNIMIPLPLLETQSKIADVLDKAKSLIDLRKKQIEKMDLLIKSKFIEMFGDPVTNPFGFETRCLREFYDSTDSIKCGPFGSALKKGEYVASGIPVWVMDNITKQGNFNDFVFLWITQEKYCELSSYKVRNGDVIISRAGTVGKMCVVNSKYDESIISTNLVRLRLGRDLVPLYFVFLITIFGNKICRFSTGQDGAFTHMNTTVLNSIQFPYPPISLQKKFVSFVESVEKHKLLQQQALNKMEMNYKSLMQEYFG